MIGVAFKKAVEERERMDQEREAMETLFRDYNQVESIGDVAKRFCKHFNISVQDLMVDSQKEEDIMYKKLFCVYTDPQFGISAVGRFLGRDHGTINYHRKNHAGLLESDPEYRRKYQLLRLLA